MAGCFPDIMVMVKNAYAYARQALQERTVLQEKKIIVRANKKRILQPLQKIYEIIPLKTSIETSPEMRREQNIIRIETYSDLLEEGFMITPRTPKHRRRRRQQIEYAITPTDERLPDYGTIPAGHFIHINMTQKKAQIIGPNAPTGNPWIPLTESFRRTAPERRDLESIRQKSLQIIRNIRASRGLPNMKTENPRTQIPELAIMMTRDNQLVCIQEESNEPTIGIIGPRSIGKTWFMNRLCGTSHHKWGKRNILMNDWQAETLPWTRPWNPKEHQKFLFYIEKVGEHTLPAPLVFLHFPSTKKVLGESSGIGFRVSLPFKKMIVDYALWMEVNKTMKLGKSFSWFKNITPKLAECTSQQQLIEVIYEKLWNEKEKKWDRLIDNPKIREKFEQTLNYLHSLQIFDTSTSKPAYWEIEYTEKKETLPPWIACLELGLIPVIVTEEIRDDPTILPLIQRQIGNDIMDWQKKEENEKNQTQVWVYYDEMERIASKRKPTAASDMLKKLFTAGRMSRIGVLYATQDYDETLDNVRQNTDHLFAFSQKGKQIKEIVSDYDPPQHIKKELHRLKTFEIVAFTKKMFVIYNLWNGERYETDKPQIGRCLPPINRHKPAKKI